MRSVRRLASRVRDIRSWRTKKKQIDKRVRELRFLDTEKGEVFWIFFH